MARRWIHSADVEVNEKSGALLVELAVAAEAVSASVNVTAQGVTALAANPTRKGAILVNDSDAVIYLKLGADPATDAAIRLNANGGSYEINATNLYTGIVTAIHAGAGEKPLLVTEM